MEKKTEQIQENGIDNSPTIWNKTANIGKKVLLGVRSGAKMVTEHTKKNIREKQLKKYNPLTAERFQSENFNIPNIIEIVDDAVRRDIEVCEGAIGWTDTVNGVEVLHMYDEWVKNSGLSFVPFAKCDSVYCIDNFDRTKFVNSENVFERATSEKIAELENIAYCLGAKNCSIEIVEENAKTQSSALKISVENNSSNTGNSACSHDQSRQRGKNISYFEGNKEPSAPSLKWFAFDDNINGLIEMKCNGNNAIKSKIIEISCITATTMSQKAAGAIDKLLKVKASMSMEKKVIKEHCSKLIFEVNF